MDEADTLKRTLERCLDELGTAILLRRAMTNMEKKRYVQGIDFFLLAYNSMFNDMIGRAIKVLDRHRDSVGYWTVLAGEGSMVESFAKANGYDLSKHDDMSKRLKIVRDKTHFHIDKKGVINPSDVWKAAEIKGSTLATVIDEVFVILAYVYKQKYGENYVLPSYDGSDAGKLIALAKEAKLIPGP